MKKRIIYTLLSGFALCMLACSPGNSDIYEIEGNIEGNAEGKQVYLYLGRNTYNNNSTPLDSTYIKDGEFRFKGKLEYPWLYTIKIMREERNPQTSRAPFQAVIPVFLGGKTTNITALLDSIPSEYQIMTNNYSYDNITIKGSSYHELYMNYIQQKKGLDIVRRVASNPYYEYLNPKEVSEKPSIGKGIELVTRIDQATDNIKTCVSTFVKEHSKNNVAIYVFMENINIFSVAEIDELLNAIPSNVQASPAGVLLTEKATTVKKTAIGAKFSDFDLQDPEGNPVKLSNYLGKGKYVLLEFWASWCGPCRADIPHLKEAYALYHPEGFEILGISMDDKKEEWVKAIKEEGILWLQASDLQGFEINNELTSLYNFNSIPACLLIAPDGTIITRNMRGSWMDKKLIELYGNKFEEKKI